jgi:hypothetical protein
MHDTTIKKSNLLLIFSRHRLLTADIRAQQLKLRCIKFGDTVCSAGSETWTVSEMDVKRLGTWERKMLRGIHGPVIEQGIWRRELIRIEGAI